MQVSVAGHFLLNVSAGRVDVLTNTTLDYEEIISYTITIAASDNGVPVLSRYIHTCVCVCVCV